MRATPAWRRALDEMVHARKLDVALQWSGSGEGLLGGKLRPALIAGS